MMGSLLEQSGNGNSDNTSKRQSDAAVESPNFDSHALWARRQICLSLTAGSRVALTSTCRAAQLTGSIVQRTSPATKNKPAAQNVVGDNGNNNNPPAPVGDNNNNNPAERNGTKIGRDSNGKENSYAADGYSVNQHDDGKWYYHQDNKDGSKFVEVNNVQMDANGKVSFHETGMFGKDGNIGGGEAPHESATNPLAAVQSFADTTSHNVLGDSGANALGNTLVDAAHGANAAVESTVIGVDNAASNVESLVNGSGQASAESRQVLNDLGKMNLNPADVWNGANVKLSDGGKFYDEWKNGTWCRDR